MASRLTAFSKFLITLLILGVLFFAGRYFLNNTKIGQDLKKQSSESASKQGQSNDNQTSSNNGNSGSNELSGVVMLVVNILTKVLRQIQILDITKNMDFL